MCAGTVHTYTILERGMVVRMIDEKFFCEDLKDDLPVFGMPCTLPLYKMHIK